MQTELYMFRCGVWRKLPEFCDPLFPFNYEWQIIRFTQHRHTDRRTDWKSISFLSIHTEHCAIIHPKLQNSRKKNKSFEMWVAGHLFGTRKCPLHIRAAEDQIQNHISKKNSTHKNWLFLQLRPGRTYTKLVRWLSSRNWAGNFVLEWFWCSHIIFPTYICLYVLECGVRVCARLAASGRAPMYRTMFFTR